MRDLQLPGRSPVHAVNGMAATSHPLATATALEVLRGGGKAIDAAVAACAVQCVVEPGSTSIGGDCFALLAPGDGGEVIAFNGSGRAPAAAKPEWFRDQGIERIERHSPHAVTVPGAVDAWARMVADHGCKELGELLQPAIRFARDGFPVHSRVARDWRNNVSTLRRDPTAARTYLINGDEPAVGSMHRLPELAETMSRIAEQGRDAFYTGAVAEDMVSYLRSLGGLHDLEDFATAAGDYVTPIRTPYRGYEVIECPPNGQGIVALIMLNILSRFSVEGMEPLSAERLHLEIEAARLGFSDRDAWLADPDKAPVPVEALLSDAHAAQLSAAIRDDKAMDPLPPPGLPEHTDTVYLCVVDGEGNAVSFINSLFSIFGTGLVSPRTGVLLQCRGMGFVLDPAHPNCIGPGKRPLHTIIPGMLARDGRVVMPFGVMGGRYQAMGHAHFLSNLIDFGLDLQEALDLPRIQTLEDGGVEVESGIPASAVEALRGMGHRTVAAAEPIGGGQAIWIDRESGVLTAGSDSRKDGCALGY